MTEKRQTILVVDDIPDDIVIIEEILKKDYQVKAVTNGEAALKVARGDPPPDLILLDIMMPGMDGFEVCRNLKEDAAGATIPVIFLTAKVMNADEKMGFALGAVDYIRKPVDPDILKTRIRAHLEQKILALSASEVRYRRLFETAKDGIVVMDTETGTIVDINPAIVAMTGLSQEAFLGKRIRDLDILSDFLARKGNLSKLQRNEYVRFKDQPITTADGRRLYIESICTRYQVNHREVMQLNIRDITDLVEAERERDELSARLAHYLATSPTVTYSLRLQGGTASWQWISENAVQILGYSREEVLEPGWWFKNLFTADRMSALGGIAELTHRKNYAQEYRFFRKDHSVIWLRDEMQLVKGEGGCSEIVGTLTNVTERKRAEEEIGLKSAALEAADNAVVITSRDGTIEWTNSAFERLTGYSGGESVGKNPRDLVRSGSQDAAFYRSLWDTILSGKVWRGTLINRRKSGESYDEEMTITPVMNESRRIEHFIAVKSDVTERTLSRERLEASLREKDALLKEVHHRVKNNMQLILSILNLSVEDTVDPSCHQILDEVSRRIEAMAIIHEQFYQSEDTARIDFSRNLQDLVAALMNRYQPASGRPRLGWAADEVTLSLEKAIPAGLIVSEFVSNALKFAYRDEKRPGTLDVALRLMNDGSLEVEVRDNGPGLPEGLDPGKTRSFGMQLIRILKEQLHGTVEYRVESGTVALLRFPLSGTA